MRCSARLIKWECNKNVTIKEFGKLERRDKHINRKAL